MRPLPNRAPFVPLYDTSTAHELALPHGQLELLSAQSRPLARTQYMSEEIRSDSTGLQHSNCRFLKHLRCVVCKELKGRRVLVYVV